MNNNQDLNLKIKAALDATQTETDLRKLSRLLRDLQSLMNEVGDSNAEAFNALNAAAAELKDRLGDAREALNAITGEPLENVSAGFNMVKDGLMNLDFGKATVGINAMATGINKLSIGETAKGMKEFAGSIVNLGKALMGNPIFALGAILVALITNFDKLANAGGLVGKIFSTLGNVISAVKQFFVDLSDAIGLTGIRVAEIADKTKAAAKQTEEWKNQMADLNKQLAQAQNLSTFIFDFKKAATDAATATTELSTEITKIANTNKRGADELIGLFKEIKNYSDGVSREVVDANGNLLDATKIYEKQSKEVDKFVGKLLDLSIKYGDMTLEEQEKYTKLITQTVVKRYQQEVLLQVSKLNQTKDIKLKELDVERKSANNIRNEVEKAKKLADIDAREKKLKLEYEAKTRISTAQQVFEAENYYNKESTLAEDKRFKALKFLQDNFQKYAMDGWARTTAASDILLSDEKKKRKEFAKDYERIYEEQFGSLQQFGVNITTIQNRQIKKSLDDSQEEFIDYLVKKNNKSKNAAKQESDDIITIQGQTVKEQIAINDEKNIKISKADLEARKTNLDDAIKNAKLRYDTLLRQAELDGKRQGLTTREIELNKQKIIKSYYEENYALVAKQYDTQIALAKGNKDKQQALETEKTLVLKNLTLDYTSAILESGDKIIEKEQELAKAREKYGKEYIQLLDEERQKILNLHQEQLDIYNSELARLDLGNQKYKDNYEEKLRLITLSFDEQRAILTNNYYNEVIAAQGKEEEITRINKKYAELRKKLKAEENESVLQATQESTQKQVQEMQAMSDSLVGIGNLLDAFDDARRDANGKLDLESQKRAFIRNKELQKGAVIINTAAGISNALSTQNYAGAVAIGIAGAAQLAKILATQFNPEGGDSGSSSSASVGTITAPTMASAPAAPLMGQGYLNQNFNPMSISTLGLKPGGEQRVYVLEGDITAIQNRVRVAESRSVLGH